MSSAVVEIEVPVEETEAYQELMTRAGRRTGKVPADLMVRHVLACVPPHEWPTRVEALDAVLRRLEAARKDSLRVEARPAEGRHLGRVCHAAARSGLAALSHDLARSRPDRGPVRLPRFHQELAGLVQAHPGRARSPPRPSARLATGEEGTGVERPAAGNGPVLGPDPAADWASATGWIASSGTATSNPTRRAVGAGCAGAQVVPLEQDPASRP